jgi:hypothetical protein
MFQAISTPQEQMNKVENDLNNLKKYLIRKKENKITQNIKITKNNYKPPQNCSTNFCSS